MAITKSQKKSIRTSARKGVYNLRKKRSMKKGLNSIKKLILDNKKEEAVKSLPEIYKVIDKAYKNGIIKKNTASRKKSKVAKAVSKI